MLGLDIGKSDGLWRLDAGPRRILGRALDWLAAARERARQRRWLAALDDRMLKDLGLSRADVARESDKRFWRP